MTLANVLTMATALLTASYVVLTYRILRANEASVASMRRQFEESHRPIITSLVSIPPSSDRIALYIRNTGSATALGLVLRVYGDVHVMGNRSQRLKDLPAFSRPIASFPPGAEMLFPLHSAHSLNADTPDLGTLEFTIGAEYTWAGSTYAETTHVDLHPYLEARVATNPMVVALQEIRDELRELDSTLKEKAQM